MADPVLVNGQLFGHLALQEPEVEATLAEVVPERSQPSGTWNLRVVRHGGGVAKKATHPCPCGFHGDPTKECTCSTLQVQRYRARISGPLLDRIDIQVEVPAVRYKELADQAAGDTSAAIRGRVDRARELQLARFKGRKIFCNAQMNARDLKRFCRPDARAEKLLETAMLKLGLSARAYTRILKVARTIADLDGQPDISAAQVGEAIQYRSLDRSFH